MTRRTAALVWAALLGVPFAFLAVARTIPGNPWAPRLEGPLLALAVAASAVNVVLARVLPRRLGPAHAHDRDAVGFARFLVSLALCEAAALAPVVAYIVTHDPRLLAVLGADALALAALYPSARRWAALLPAGDAGDPAADPAARRREAP